jgi:uncharacterized membrane protein YfcA
MAVTKVLNVVSSLVATLLFAMRGMIDWKLGAILSLAAFTGALVGAVFARRMSNLWLRRVFLGAVVILAAKMLLFDVDWKSYWPPSRAISAKAETVSSTVSSDIHTHSKSGAIRMHHARLLPDQSLAETDKSFKSQISPTMTG